MVRIIFSDFHVDFDLLIKWLRQLISVIAWSWAILVFIVGYLGRGGEYDPYDHTHRGAPPYFTSVFLPVLKVLVVAPGSAFALGIPPTANSNSAGYHGVVQGMGMGRNSFSSAEQESWALPQQNKEGNAELWGQLCAGCSSPRMMQNYNSETGREFGRSGLQAQNDWNYAGQNIQQQQGQQWGNVQQQQPNNMQMYQQQRPAALQHKQELSPDGRYR
jgi:hypothetical protein